MTRKWLFALILFSLLALVACDQRKKAVPTVAQPEEPAIAPAVPVVVPEAPAVAVLPSVDATPLRPLSERDYSFGYWLNEMRKHADNHSAEVLCLETGTFGFALNLADLTEGR